MSEDGNQRPARIIGAALIIIALTIFVLFLGYLWSRGALSTRQNVAGDISEAMPASAMKHGDQGSEPDQTISRATVTAPIVPTPIATSKPVAPSLPLPSFENPVVEQFAAEAATWGATFIRVNDENSGVWQYEADNFIRPIGLEVYEDQAFLLDGGRVLILNLETPEPPQILLAAGDVVSGVRVLEPLDLAIDNNVLYVLDRAGDVYRYDIGDEFWEVDRYDRPVEASSGHYFVALDAASRLDETSGLDQQRTLLETNYKFSMQYGGEKESLWNLPEGRSVDVTVFDDDVFVLQREMFDAEGFITKYRDTRSLEEFVPAVEIETPRQLVATEMGLLVLDQDGRRLLALDRDNGRLHELYQLPQDEPISVFAVDAAGRLIMAGRNRLYFLEQPERLAAPAGGPVVEGIQPHDISFLSGLDNYTVPIGGSNITFRDFQLPGAPRHYRLGVHEGLDFYWQPGTKVLSAADGKVIRADLDYVGPSAVQLAAWWNESQQRGFTTREMLDNYLGRQVWIEHDNGLVSRYAHLRSIESGIAAGVNVTKGQMIGEVGNSGSPASLESERSDAHLHFELWLGDSFLGQYLRPIETREWIERIFAN